MKGLIKQVLKEETNDIDYVWFFYDRFLNRQPIEFEGLFLEPTYDKKNDTIIWDVANPNDYSFNYNILHDIIMDEFKSFARIMNIDLMLYKDFIVKFWHKPRFNCYIGKKDRQDVEKMLSSKTKINFKSDEQFLLNLISYMKIDNVLIHMGQELLPLVEAMLYSIIENPNVRCNIVLCQK